MFGQSGHGFSAARSRGGSGSSSNCATERGTLAVHGAEAIGAGIAAADDDHVLAGRRDRRRLRHVVALAAAVLLRQIVHGEVDALEAAALDGEIAR